MSQNEDIFDWLFTESSITALEALHRFGCLRLSGRIYDLRQAGHKIDSEWVTLRNGKRVSKYVLRKP